MWFYFAGAFQCVGGWYEWQRSVGVTRSFKEQESTSANFLLPCNPGRPTRATLRLEWTNMDLVNGIEDIERDNSVES